MDFNFDAWQDVFKTELPDEWAKCTKKELKQTKYWIRCKPYPLTFTYQNVFGGPFKLDSDSFMIVPTQSNGHCHQYKINKNEWSPLMQHPWILTLSCYFTSMTHYQQKQEFKMIAKTMTYDHFLQITKKKRSENALKEYKKGVEHLVTEDTAMDIFIKHQKLINATTISTSAFDKHSKLLYLYFYKEKFVKINLNNKTYQILLKKISNQHELFENWATSIIINGEFHIIGGINNNQHLIWNDNTRQFDQIWIFNEFGRGWASPKLIHIKSKNVLYAFAGWNTMNGINSNIIYKYNINNKRWYKLSTLLPFNLNGFGYDCTISEQYIIIFGGVKYIQDKNGSNNIYIFNIKTESIKKIDLKCPEKGQHRAIIMHDKYENSLLVSGFIRIYQHLVLIPKDLMRYIENWHLNEYVFLMNAESNTHWKIKTSHIIQ